jgi:rubrerythrin
MKLFDADALIAKVHYHERPVIQNAPTIAAAPVRRGTWKIKLLHFVCTVCGHGCKNDYDYCPFCGADMRGNANV